MPKSDNGGSRLDRIEAILEAGAARQADIEDEFRRLLRAQVVVVDTLGQLAAEQVKLAAEQVKLAAEQVKLAEQQVKLAEQQRSADQELHTLIGDTEEKLNALISIVDDIVRRTPRQQ
jgi:peptidoglycan hydrolase CwlO-like protein